MAEQVPDWFASLRTRYPEVMQAVESLGEAVHQQGPIDARTAHLIQLAAAATLRSEGGVHSHARRALEAGATPAEVEHALLLVTSTIGFPNVAAALNWVADILRPH